MKALLYLLMRDEVPTGVVAKIVQDLEKHKGMEFDFTNPHLAAMAEEYARRLDAVHA